MLDFFYHCRAIQASLELCHQSEQPLAGLDQPIVNSDSSDQDSDLHLALLLSQQEEEKKRQREEHERLEEQKLLAEIMELSLKEK